MYYVYAEDIYCSFIIKYILEYYASIVCYTAQYIWHFNIYFTYKFYKRCNIRKVKYRASGIILYGFKNVIIEITMKCHISCNQTKTNTTTTLSVLTYSINKYKLCILRLPILYLLKMYMYYK